MEYNFKSLVSSGETVRENVKAGGKAESVSSFREISGETGGEITVIFAGEDEAEAVLVSSGKKNWRMPAGGLKSLSGISPEKVITNDAKELFKKGLGRNPVIHDIILMAYILNPEKNYREVTHVFTECLGGTFLSFSDVAGRGAKKIMFELADPETVRKYTVSMLSAAREAAPALEEKLKKENLYEIYSGMEIPVAHVLAKMEKTGLNIDRAHLDRLLDGTEKEIKETEKMIFSESGGEFNINSPKQLSEVLFDRLGLPRRKKIKTGYSTNNEVLKALENMHPVVPAILKYRTIVKLKTGFLDVLKK